MENPVADVIARIRVCRACMSRENLLPLFQKTDRHEKYSVALYLTTGLQIKLNDGLPQFICNQCTQSLKMSLHFRVQSQQTAKKFMKFVIAKVKNFREDSVNAWGNIVPVETLPPKIKVKTKLSPEKHTTQLQYSNSEIIDNKKLKNVDDVEWDECDFEVHVENYNCNDDKTSNHNKIKRRKRQDSILNNKVDIMSNDKTDERNYSESDSGCDDFEFTYGLKFEREREREFKKKLRTRIDKLLVQPVNESEGYKCTLCHKFSKNYHSFRVHASTHLPHEFLCHMCGKTFCKNEALVRHCMLMHNAKRNLHCPHCNYSAVDNTLLQIHIRRDHTGERPFVCDICGASFYNRINLIPHVSIHQNERPFKCPHCPKTFKSKMYMHGHVYRSHAHKFERVACYVCGEKYSRCFVKKHILRQHGIPIKQQKPMKIEKFVPISHRSAQLTQES